MPLTKNQIPNDACDELLSDLGRKLATEDLLEWIEITAQKYSAFGDRGDYIEISPELLSAFGVTRYESSRETLGTASVSISSGAGLVIRHHKFQTAYDQRFWIAHELAHLLWRNPNDRNASLSRYERTLGSDPTVEWLCNRFAAALLLPRGLIRRWISRVNMTAGGHVDYKKIGFIPYLSRQLRVPERLFARRLWHELGGQRLALYALRSIGSETSELNWRIQWDAIPRTRLTRIRRLAGRRIPLDMLPLVLPHNGAFDGRWMELVDKLETGRIARPLAKIRSESLCSGFADVGITPTDRDRLFVAIHLSDSALKSELAPASALR